MGGAYADLSIDYFYQLGPQTSKFVLGALAGRKIYKRLFEVPFLKIRNLGRILEKVKDAEKRKQLTLELNEAIKLELVTGIQKSKESKYSFDSSTSDGQLLKWDDDHIYIVIDAPVRAVDPSTSSPMVVADYRRKYSHIGRDVSERSDSGASADAIQSILKEAAYFRVFSHPEIHDLILRYVNPVVLSETIERIAKIEIKND